MFMTLSRGLTAGPAVSLRGSPTVSPVTAALWLLGALAGLPVRGSSSTIFLALSQAPPALPMKPARSWPDDDGAGQEAGQADRARGGSRRGSG